MNIPVLYILISVLITIAMGRGIMETAIIGSKKRLRLATGLAIVMSLSWLVLNITSGKEAPDGFPFLITFIPVLVVFVAAIGSTVAMIGVIFVDRESLPGKG